MLSLAAVALLIMAALFAPLLAPHDPNAIDLAARLRGPDGTHLLGTDHLGRDVLSRLLYGTRISLGAVALILGLILALGIGTGALAGYAGGKVDALIMRICDMFLTVPTFVLAMFMIGALGTGLENVVLAIALSHWAWYTRLVRGLVLSLKTRDYVLAARVAGVGEIRIFASHVLPGVAAQLVVLATLDIGHMMLHVSGLSFLGLGVAAPTPEWGVMISDARQFIWTQPLLLLWPGLMILLTVMAFNRLGDAFRDALDPALRADKAVP